MQSIRINDRLSIAGQPTAADLAEARQQGFAVAVNLRPNGEDGAPGDRASRDAAREAGLAYSFIPVTMETLTEADVEAFRAALAEAKGPVFAYCRSGARVLALHAIGEVLEGRMTMDEVAALGAAHGLDMSGAVAWLERRHNSRPQVKGFFDPRTWSVQYVVADPATRHCAIIDPVLDYDEKSGQTSTANADRILAYVAEKGLTVEWIDPGHPSPCGSFLRCAVSQGKDRRTDRHRRPCR